MKTSTNTKLILIMGTPGSGKTTLSHELSQKLDIKLIHLDDFRMFREHKTSSLYRHYQLIKKINCMNERYIIIDGNHLKNNINFRLVHADKIIYIKCSLCKCLYSLWKREGFSFLFMCRVIKIHFSSIYFIKNLNNENKCKLIIIRRS